MEYRNNSYQTGYYTLAFTKEYFEQIKSILEENNINTLRLGQTPKKKEQKIYVFVTIDTASKLSSLLSMEGEVIDYKSVQFKRNSFEGII